MGGLVCRQTCGKSDCHMLTEHRDEMPESGHIAGGSWYDIPYSAGVRGPTNLLACGRCVSADHLAMASLRVMGPSMATGQAAEGRGAGGGEGRNDPRGGRERAAAPPARQRGGSLTETHAQEDDYAQHYGARHASFRLSTSRRDRGGRRAGRDPAAVAAARGCGALLIERYGYVNGNRGADCGHSGHAHPGPRRCL